MREYLYSIINSIINSKSRNLLILNLFCVLTIKYYIFIKDVTFYISDIFFTYL